MAKLKLTPAQRRKVDIFDIEQSILVPSTTSADKLVSPTTMKRRIRNVRKFLSKKYGGYTSTKGMGGYVSEQKGLIKEPVVKVTSFATKKAFKRGKQDTLQRISKWAKTWGQESVGYEHEGGLYYIERNLPKSVRKKLKRRRRK